MKEKFEHIIKRQTAKPDNMEFARLAHHKAYHDVVENQFGKWDTGMQEIF